MFKPKYSFKKCNQIYAVKLINKINREKGHLLACGYANHKHLRDWAKIALPNWSIISIKNYNRESHKDMFEWSKNLT